MAQTTFYDAVSLDEEELVFKAKGVMISLANALRRAMMNEILTLTVAPETIKIVENTSPWEADMIKHQLVFVPLQQKGLVTNDLNMLELSLDVTNETDAYRWVLAEEMKLTNKETTEEVLMRDVVQKLKNPLFSLGPGQKVKLTASLEYMTKVEAEGTPMAARHQAGTAGYEYEADIKRSERDPEEIIFHVSMHTGLPHHEHIMLAFDALIARIRDIHEAVKTQKQEKFYLQMNKDHRYDFVILGETHTIGNLVARWINRHETNAFAGYRDTRDRKAITIDYGLFRYAPPLLREAQPVDDIKELVETSLTMLDPKKELEQRDATKRTFIEHLKRLEAHIIKTQDEWKKVKIRSA
jgi:hypothetical protein